ncbi:MAG: hypothetical protein M1832_003801 [Thelocarpon impressellum]|nr:MAG: hypothetical protein M1832_003801 [Thelocarpon impressellum]
MPSTEELGDELGAKMPDLIADIRESVDRKVVELTAREASTVRALSAAAVASMVGEGVAALEEAISGEKWSARAGLGRAKERLSGELLEVRASIRQLEVVRRLLGNPGESGETTRADAPVPWDQVDPFGPSALIRGYPPGHPALLRGRFPGSSKTANEDAGFSAEKRRGNVLETAVAEEAFGSSTEDRADKAAGPSTEEKGKGKAPEPATDKGTAGPSTEDRAEEAASTEKGKGKALEPAAERGTAGAAAEKGKGKVVEGVSNTQTSAAAAPAGEVQRQPGGSVPQQSTPSGAAGPLSTTYHHTSDTLADASHRLAFSTAYRHTSSTLAKARSSPAPLSSELQPTAAPEAAGAGESSAGATGYDLAADTLAEPYYDPLETSEFDRVWKEIYGDDDAEGGPAGEFERLWNDVSGANTTAAGSFEDDGGPIITQVLQDDLTVASDGERPADQRALLEFLAGLVAPYVERSRALRMEDGVPLDLLTLIPRGECTECDWCRWEIRGGLSTGVPSAVLDDGACRICDDCRAPRVTIRQHRRHGPFAPYDRFAGLDVTESRPGASVCSVCCNQAVSSCAGCPLLACEGCEVTLLRLCAGRLLTLVDDVLGWDSVRNDAVLLMPVAEGEEDEEDEEVGAEGV